jgi:RHS repeat-associated protein
VEAVPCNIRLPGQYHDAETGLHYNWHRYYDPNTGRYISADPIGIAGGLNLYGYWSKVPPGTAWRLAEEQLEAARVPQLVREEYFRTFNEYLETLR